jgi:hypothetical protein
MSPHVPLVFPKLMCLLKSPLDQNSIVIYHKFNGDFKSHTSFWRHKGDMGVTCWSNSKCHISVHQKNNVAFKIIIGRVIDQIVILIKC